MVVVKPGLPTRNQKLSFWRNFGLCLSPDIQYVNNVCPGIATDGRCSELVGFHDTGAEWHLLLGLLKTYYRLMEIPTF